MIVSPAVAGLGVATEVTVKSVFASDTWVISVSELFDGYKSVVLVETLD